MALTYVPAAARDAYSVRVAVARVRTGPLAIAALSALSGVLLLSAYIGRTTVSRRTDGPPAANLNTVTDVAALETALQGAFENAADRRFAARELFAFLVSADGVRRQLPNVGAIARVEVPLKSIESDSRLSVYRDRAQAAKDRAAAAGRGLERIPLFTSADITEVKSALTVRSLRGYRRTLLIWAALFMAAFHAVWLVWRIRLVRGDYVLLGVAHLLTAIGFAAMVARSDPLRDTMLFVRFAQGTIIGAGLMAAASLLNVRRMSLSDFSFVPLAGACVLSLLLIVFGSGPAGSNAKVNLGPAQPIEAIRLLLALFLAGYFARRWELLRAVRGQTVRGRPIPAWVNAPSLYHVLPVLLGVATALALFFLQRDLGPALILSVLFLTMYVVARAKVLMALAGGALLTAGFYLGYQLRISATLAERVRMWQSPWDNAARGGDQISHALWAMSTGATSGTGLGLGDTRYLPAGHTDLILASIGEELGFVGVIVVSALYAALVWRGFHIARRAGTDYGVFLSLGLTLLIALPLVLMMAGTIGLVPLTGVVTPFLSYGGSAMAANFAALGVLASLRSNDAPADLKPFARPLRWVGTALTVLAVILVAAAVRVQVVSADELLVRPHLGMQADGTRRYQYNPRVLDAARQIPRGNVLDRRGLPLATEDAALARRARADFQRLGIVVDETCRSAGERCYPLGGRAYHLLGDARTRLDWSATNTSFVERDAEAKLRGFDDHQATVRTVDASGAQTWTLRRDYREMIPLVRHRYQPNHPSVRALLARAREVKLTIDAALQVRTAEILAMYARRSTSGRAAAVVIDPKTGDLLASVSYPWPSGDDTTSAVVDPNAGDALLDRARYGLYPPGSTFKLITAAAALRRNSRAHREEFVCSRLPDGRVGAKVAGWGRPVRDDVLDRTPHGKIGMHRALVVSCNAYFAQLAVELGPQPLLDAADRVDVALARGNAVAQVRDALPQVGYGQAEVLATPLRMARVAAAIADGGRVRDVRWQLGAPPSPPEPFMTPDAARLLATYMRDVVTTGTGRGIRGTPQAIAGKTGTAEVAGAPSHSWFVGFAPYGTASRRVAVAVILENAGYGGASAAPAAGEIVAAAAALGYVR